MLLDHSIHNSRVNHILLLLRVTICHRTSSEGSSIRRPDPTDEETPVNIPYLENGRSFSRIWFLVRPLYVWTNRIKKHVKVKNVSQFLEVLQTTFSLKCQSITFYWVLTLSQIHIGTGLTPVNPGRDGIIKLRVSKRPGDQETDILLPLLLIKLLKYPELP